MRIDGRQADVAQPKDEGCEGDGEEGRGARGEAKDGSR